MRVPVSPASARSTFSGSVMIAVPPPRSRKSTTASHLRRHAPRQEVRALRQVLLRLGQRHPVDPPLRRLAEVEGDLLDRGRDEEQLGPDLVREQRACVILVDHRCDPGQLAVRIRDDGDAAAADRDHDEAGSRSGIGSRRPRRSGSARARATTRRQPRPASSSTDQPSRSRRRIASASSMNEPIGFEGLWKAGSSADHLHLGHDRHGVLRSRPSRWKSFSRFCCRAYPIAPWRVGTADVERHLVQLVCGKLGAAEDEPDLRAVAVRRSRRPSRP